MYQIDGITFKEYYVESVELDLTTCKITLNVIFYQYNKNIKLRKKYTFNTNCDVNINDYIDKLEIKTI